MANFLGRLQTFLFGAAIGRASSDAVTPVLEPVKQHAWFKNQNKVLDPGTAAEAVAQGIIAEAEGQFDANRGGVADNRFGVLWRMAQRVPGVSEARALRRRAKDGGDGRQITLAQLHHVYAKGQIEPQYWDALDALVLDILSPGELAAAIHRGLIPDPGAAEGEPPLLQGEQPKPPFKVDAYPVYPIDALKEAQGSGYNRDRLGVLVGLQGLPMGTHEAAQAFFRGIITHGDYIRAFNESNSRNEWAQAVLDYTRQIPTARDFFENALRGYHDLDWAQEQAKRHGMSPEDSLVIYQNQGRPMNLRLITQALARGGKFKPEPGEIKDPFMAAIVEGNLKPAYYDLALANRYTLPSAFTMRSLAQTGVWDEAKTAQRLKEAGWIPEDADQAANAWSGGAGGVTSNPWVTKARNQLWTAIHRSFLSGELDRAGADSKLQTLIPDLPARNEVLDLWTIEDEATTKPLTAAAVKKAYSASDLTIDEAVARLVAQQWAPADARLYLTT